MSRAYRVLIPIARLDISRERGVVLDIDLLPILPPEQMNELLERALRERGAIERDGVLVVQLPSGVEQHFDLDRRELAIRIDRLLDENMELWVDEEWLSRAQLERARDDTIQLEPDELGKFDDYARSVAEENSAEMQRTLAREAHRARQDLHGILKDVYRDAVKQKAASMGNVTSITESEQGGEYRIRIELDG